MFRTPKKMLSGIIAAIALVVIVIIAGFTFSSVMNFDSFRQDIPEEKYTAQWTTFMWFCGDGNLADWNMMLCDIHFLEFVSDSEEVNIVCILDRQEHGDTKIVKIQYGESAYYNITEINPEWTEHELNLGDPDPLLQFLKWGATEYPAYKYNVHLVNHGGGWRGMCWDESSHDHLSLPEIRWVCEEFKTFTGRNIDILSTEGCLVGMLEFGYELRDTCDYFVGGSTYGWGAEAEPDKDIWEPGNWQYDTCWQMLVDDPYMTGAEFAIVMSETFKPYGPWRGAPFIPKEGYSDVMATYNLSKIAELVDAVDLLAQDLLSACTGIGQTVNQGILINTVIGHPETPDEMHTESFSAQMDWIGLSIYTNYDLYDFAYMLTKATAGTLRNSQKAQEVMRLVDEVVMIYRCIDQHPGHPDARGISIYIPYRSSTYNAEYEEIQFAQDTQWDEFLKSVTWT